MFPFMNPIWAARQMGNRVSTALLHPQPFDQIKPPPKYSTRDVGIIASTFNPVNPLEHFFPNVGEEGIRDPTETLLYVKKLLPVGMGLEVAVGKDLYSDSARAFFNEPIHIPVLEHKHLSTKWNICMSLSPNEIWTMRSGIRAATGSVVLGGLGMGYLLTQIAAKKTVKSIVVIEKNQALLDWFGYELCKWVGKKVISVVCDDVFNWINSFENDAQFASTRFLLDIWDGHGDALSDKRLKELQKKSSKVWAWGGTK